jgi:NAD(P)-dependent dehydrogenase (short-subunit alcohol dehydrogenase family)
VTRVPTAVVDPPGTPLRVAVVTGSSSGFGLLTAQHLAAAGFRVFATMRTIRPCEELAQCEVLALDVTDPESVQNAVREVHRRAGRIDVLVNNAGIAIAGFFEDLTDQEIRQQFEANFFGALEVTRQVLPVMRQHGAGRIINISSISGLLGQPVLTGYAASKHALEGFSESLAHEVAHLGIEVVLIEPGTFRTEIFAANRRIGERVYRPDSAYADLVRPIEERINRLVAQSAADPRQVATLIAKVAQVKRPRSRYLVGDAKLQAWLKAWLPARWMNALVRHMVGLPRRRDYSSLNADGIGKRAARKAGNNPPTNPIARA